MRPHHIIFESLVQSQLFADALLIHLLPHSLQLFYSDLKSLDPLPLHNTILEGEPLGYHLCVFNLPGIDVILRVEHGLLREDLNETACEATNQRCMVLLQKGVLELPHEILSC